LGVLVEDALHLVYGQAPRVGDAAHLQLCVLGLMCGSSPEPDAVTASAGISSGDSVELGDLCLALLDRRDQVLVLGTPVGTEDAPPS
jgi:hypothetical protein